MKLTNQFYMEFIRNVGTLPLDTPPSAERSWERLVIKKNEEKIVWLKVRDTPFWGLRFDLQQNGGIKLLNLYDRSVKPYDRCVMWDNDFRARLDDDPSTSYPLILPYIDVAQFSLWHKFLFNYGMVLWMLYLYHPIYLVGGTSVVVIIIILIVRKCCCRKRQVENNKQKTN